ncbi:hypothetical protein J3L16_13230 [Alteromonas sp. 5E99-2]|uniref:hypothetical protein n=1 Tax=Alteromonas sp. 5E99-2 TaxID=2817683 RepID=UPI001A999743|nr:hypothetical protein [Alteromonas sp. 5E99-2]MBO1256649.1 hypothetical protein [Alteromonas sp. 5E99-2]
MIPKRTLKEIDKVETYSKQLAQDGLAIFELACKPASERTCAGHDVTIERFKNLIKYIELFNDTQDTKHFQRFIKKGFSAIKDPAEWQYIEQELYLKELNGVFTKRGGSILSDVLNLAKVYFNAQNIWSPSQCKYGKRAIDISDMYLYPSGWCSSFYKLARKLLDLPNGHTKYKSAIGATLSAFKESRNDQDMIAHIDAKGSLEEVLDKDALFNLLIFYTPDKNKSRLHKARKVHNPELHGNEAKQAPRNSHVLKAGSTEKGAHWLHKLSPKWFSQAQSYVLDVYENKGQKEAISTITRLTKISSAIFDIKDQLPNLDHLHSSGISAFFENDYALIKSIYAVEDNRLDQARGELFLMHSAINGINVSVTDIMEYAIPFECDSGDDEYRYIILDGIAKRFPQLAKKLAEYAKYELRRIDGFKKSIDTTFGVVGSLQSIFNNHLNELDKNDLELLAKHGIDAFEKNNCRIIKRIRYALKQKFESDELKLGSAKQVQRALKIFCEHYNLTEVNAYEISAGKRKKNEDKRLASDYYTIEDVVSITYAIELGLSTKSLSSHDELLLRLARVFIKTGWNLSPVLRLEVDDILQLSAPITGKAMHFVRLFKKRAKYDTQFYEFDMDADNIDEEGLIFGKEVTNALSDLEYIRDKLSSYLRAQLKPDSKLKYRLALYKDEDGKTFGFAKESFSSKVNDVLKMFQCDVSFNTQRIRKGGLNYVYKKFAKDFKKYKKAGQHSLKVFLDVYLRDDGIGSEEKIASASTTMSDYFSGRPLTDDIIIVTEIPASTKQTPSGRCASQGNDEEAEAFRKAQQRLNKDSGTETSQCGDFNACLFCRHFRLVADAEHVWRLLSYQYYVVGEMERGVSDYEGTTDQAEYIEIINNRVDEILDELSEYSQEAVSLGRDLLEEKGCHEDWAFFANLGAL